MNHRDIIQSVSNWFKKRKDVELVSRFFRIFPSPDVFIRLKTGESISVECKPSGQSGREYLTGFGQSISYFTVSDFSYLALPGKELEKYRKYFIVSEVGLLSVSREFVKEERKPKKFKVKRLKIEYPQRGYAYYRDLSPEEVYKILLCIKQNATQPPEIIKQQIWKEITKTRNLKSKKQQMGWLLNIRLFLRDLDLIDADSFSLKPNGYALLEFDITKNQQKQLFLSELSRCLLIDGNYIDIVGLIQELNDANKSFESISKFIEKLSQRIYEEKLASSRTSVTRDVKDIIRILRLLGILTDYDNRSKKYYVRWSKILPLIRLR